MALAMIWSNLPINIIDVLSLESQHKDASSVRSLVVEEEKIGLGLVLFVLFIALTAMVEWQEGASWFAWKSDH